MAALYKCRVIPDRRQRPDGTWEDHTQVLMDTLPLPTTGKELLEACQGGYSFTGHYRSKGRNGNHDPYPLMAVLRGCDGETYVLRNTVFAAIDETAPLEPRRPRRWSAECDEGWQVVTSSA